VCTPAYSELVLEIGRVVAIRAYGVNICGAWIGLLLLCVRAAPMLY